MKVSVSTWSFTNCGFTRPEQIVDAAAENGIEALDLTLDDYEKYFQWTEKDEAGIAAHFSALRSYAAARGVEIFQSHAPMRSFRIISGKNFGTTR